MGSFGRTSIQFLLIFCLTFSLPTQFCMWRFFRGNYRGLFSACVDFREKISTEDGIFRAIRKTIKLKFISNEGTLRRVSMLNKDLDIEKRGNP